MIKRKKRNFYNLSEQRHYSIDIPELYGKFICGSSHGWLFTVDNRVNGCLLNPFSRECYELPPFPPLNEKFNVTACVEEKDDDNPIYTYTFKEMQTYLVHKAILSDDPSKRSDFTAMILFGEPCRLAMWRPGDTEWVVPLENLHHIEDVIFFKDKCYAVGPSRLLHEVLMGQNPTIIDTSFIIPAHEYGECWKYFVDFEGQLLLVRRTGDPMGVGYPTEKVDVAMLDLKEETWHFLDNIGGRALFVGNNLSVVGDPEKFPACVRNGIYFGDVKSDYYWRECGHDIGVYDMIEGTVCQFCPDSEVFHPSDAALTWFTPNQ